MFYSQIYYEYQLGDHQLENIQKKAIRKVNDLEMIS